MVSVKLRVLVARVEGRARLLRGATVTALGYPVGTVVCVQAKDMKEPWCLAASTTTSSRAS